MEGHVTHTIKRALGAIKQMWNTGERKFKGDFKIIVMLFDNVVKRIIL